jgi:RNA polymerase sigma-70 factor (ECF subfamily)
VQREGQYLRLVGPAEAPSSPGFNALFSEHYAFVHRTLRALGVEPMAVDDAAQEVFLVVHRRLGDYDGRAPVRAWIFGITRRVAHDFRRTVRRQQARLSLIEDRRSVPTPEHHLTQQQAVAQLERYLDSLGEIRRAVFVLCDIEEMTAPEVATALGIKLNTVYSHLRKARLAVERAMTSERPREVSDATKS